jgi:hypothetical protein
MGHFSELPLDQKGRASVGTSRDQVIPDFLSPLLMEVFELFAKSATVPEVAQWKKPGRVACCKSLCLIYPYV